MKKNVSVISVCLALAAVLLIGAAAAYKNLQISVAGGELRDAVTVPAGQTLTVLGTIDASSAEGTPGFSGAGTVTSVGLSMPSIFSVANSPITGAGTLAVTATDPGADRLFFWDDSAGALDYLILGTNLSISDDTLNASGGGGGGSGSVTTLKEDGSQVGGADIETLDFLGADFDLNESPDTEVNIVIAAAITRDTEWDTAAEINAATTDQDFLLESDIGSAVLAPDGDGSELTSVDAATGDSATAFFDAGTLDIARLPVADVDGEYSTTEVMSAADRRAMLAPVPDNTYTGGTLSGTLTTSATFTDDEGKTYQEWDPADSDRNIIFSDPSTTGTPFFALKNIGDGAEDFVVEAPDPDVLAGNGYRVYGRWNGAAWEIWSDDPRSAAVALAGITDLGTGVATALAVDTGSAGAFQLNNAAFTDSVAGATVVASGFGGNLTTDDDTLQEIADAFDAFSPTGVGSDEIGTDELDDGTDTPGSGQYVRVDTDDQAGFEYRSASETRIDLGLVIGTNVLAPDGDGSALTSVDAATGDSATAFFDAGTIEHERGGLEADVSAFGGLVRIASGSTTAVTDLSGLNTALSASIADGAHLTQEQIEDFSGAMFSGNTETLIAATYQDADGTVDLVVDSDLHNFSWTNVDATDLKTGSVTQAYDADLDDLADGSLTGSKVGSGINGENITDDTIDDDALDFGSGTDQIDSDDIPEGSTNLYVTAANVGGVSANLDDTDASIEWEDAGALEADGSLSADVVAAAQMADADHGDVAWSSGVASVQAVSGANAVDSDAYVDGSIDREHLSAAAQLTYVEIHATSHTLSISATTGEGYGSVHYITASGVTLTLPAVATGASFTVICTTANIGIVDANGSDLILLDGTALDDGDSIDSTGDAGSILVITYYDTTGWYAATDGWVDGGAS